MYSINLQGPFGANHTDIDRFKQPKSGKLKTHLKSNSYNFRPHKRTSSKTGLAPQFVYGLKKNLQKKINPCKYRKSPINKGI